MLGTPWQNFQVTGIGSGALETRGTDVIRLLGERGVKISPGNRLERAVNRVREVNKDPSLLESMSDSDADLLLHASRDIFDAFVVTWTLIEKPQYAYLFPNDKLAKLFEGADSPLLDANSTPRNIQFELVVGAHFALGDATLLAEEPDYVLAYGTKAVGIAVKRLSSVKPAALESRLRDGAGQIQKHTDHGFVAVNLDAWIEDLSGADADAVGTQFEQQVREAYGRIAKVAKLKDHLMGVLVFGTWLRWQRVEGQRTLQWRNPFQFLGFADSSSDEAIFDEYFSGLRRAWEHNFSQLAKLVQTAA